MDIDQDLEEAAVHTCVLCGYWGGPPFVVAVNPRLQGTGRTGPKYSEKIVQYWCDKCRRDNKSRWRHAAGGR